ncbi:Ankyrin repeat and SOCS box protein 6 [Podospora pseudocomata]|uniref:Ankyrin repeat and SOCS box protein 6 n=1 Tax=Podospora pseudocomata TaxID=2093779 RepID=A0ABR0G775_9PEZI|nr:Ankyrin repeat and SOCS box protein 6 [Podospora pseudocomata]
MANPLSLVASAIAIIQGGEKLRKLVRKAQELNKAPAEVELLLREISEARTSFTSLQSTVIAAAQGARPINFEALRSLLHQYSYLLDSMELLVDKYLLKSPKQDAEGGDERAGMERSVVRLGWVRKKTKVHEMQDKLRNVRFLIVDTTYRRERKLRVRGSRGSYHRIQAKRVTTGQDRGNPDNSRGNDKGESSESSSWAYPIDFHVRPMQPMINGAFHLPHWIASRAIILTLINGPSISVSLTVARIVPPDSDIFRYIQTGNCSGLQTLLLKGQASPADMIESLYGTLDALLFALNCNQYEICQLLLSWGADPHAENSTKLTDSAANMARNLSIECPSPANNARKHLIESTFPAPLDLDRRQFSLLHKTVLGLAYTNLPALLATCSPDALNARDCHGVPLSSWPPGAAI